MIAEDKNIRITQLVDRFLKSDELAFTQLFNELWEPGYEFALFLVRDKDEAEDIVQNAWIQIWQKKHSLSNTNFRGYVRTCIRNGCYKYLRDRKLEKVHEDVLSKISFDAEVTTKSDLEALEARMEPHINRLQPRCQEIFRLSKMDDLTNEEISLKLNISKKTVQNQLSLALEALHHSLRSFVLFLPLLVLWG